MLAVTLARLCPTASIGRRTGEVLQPEIGVGLPTEAVPTEAVSGAELAIEPSRKKCAHGPVTRPSDEAGSPSGGLRRRSEGWTIGSTLGESGTHSDNAGLVHPGSEHIEFASRLIRIEAMFDKPVRRDQAPQ